MATTAQQLRQAYIGDMMRASSDSVLGRVRDLWWGTYAEALAEPNGLLALNSLDSHMDRARAQFLEMAQSYAASRSESMAKQVQLSNQFLKSNTGKMFERFVGLALTQALEHHSSKYAIIPFKNEYLRKVPSFEPEKFRIRVSSGGKDLFTRLDADLIAIAPESPDSRIYMLSIKSTLKDRFHNVPFWNLLRKLAIDGGMEGVMADDPEFLRHVHYVGICSDLAEEQPDFGSDKGPRSLLQIDALLLDAAYVTASRARGLLNEGPHFGPQRVQAFHWLHRFAEDLIQGSEGL